MAAWDDFSVAASFFYGTEDPEKSGICSEMFRIHAGLDTRSSENVLSRAPKGAHI